MRHSCVGDLKSKMPSDFQGFDFTSLAAMPGWGVEEGSRPRGSEKNPWGQEGRKDGKWRGDLQCERNKEVQNSCVNDLKSKTPSYFHVFA